MTPKRLQVLKTTADFGVLLIHTLDLRDLITALEAAQERIATLEAHCGVLFTIADAVLPSDFVENKELGEAWRHAHSIGALK